MNNTKLKVKARKGLNKNLKPLVLATLFFFGFALVCNIIAGLSDATWLAPVLMLIVEALFMPGYIKMATQASKNRKVKIEDFFSETDLFFKYLGIFFVMFLIVLLLGMLESIAFKSLIAIMFYNAEISLGLSIFLIAFGLILTSSILIVTLYIVISFSQVLFVINENPKISIREAFGQSFDMMETHVLDYFLLGLSFLGWIILGMFTFGILYLWLYPYVVITFACFYEVVKKEYVKFLGEKEPEKIPNNKDVEEVIKK